MKLLLTVFSFLISGITLGCQCNFYKKFTEKDYIKYDLIFLGRVLDFDTNSSYNFTYVIDKKYRGKTKSDTLIINAEGGHCAFTPDIGHEVLMFVYKDLDGTLYTKKCSRSCLIDERHMYYLQRKERVTQDIKFLDAKLIERKN